MTRLFLNAALLAGLMLAMDIPRTSGDDKDDKGWVQLFNGKDLTGWKLPPEPNKGAIKEVRASAGKKYPKL